VNPEQLLAHVKRLASTLSPRQIATLAAAFVGVVGVVVGSAYWLNAPSYSLLFSDMDADSASAVVSKLKTDKVAYVLEDGGRTVKVASNKVDELRLQFAGQGMPASGRIGFEIFDRTAFGTTEFLEHVNYRRALEGELARTIGTITEVASARVHIAMEKESLFTTQQEPAKASVVLKLRSNRPLAAAAVMGITNLVAASVEGLRPESVVIVDTFGRPLTRTTDAEDEGSGLQLDKEHRMERDLSTKVVSLLEPIVGEGHVRVNVSARLDGDSEEETEERFDPNTVIRSKQTSSDTGSFVAQAGVAGARANAPPNTSTATTAPVQAAAPQTASRTTETTNYEVSKLTRHKISPKGQLARLTVAVILDDEHVTSTGKDGKVQVKDKPRAPADIERIQKLVASAVGADTTRGDVVTVENMAFNEPPPDDTAPLKWYQRISPTVTSVGTSGVLELLRVLGVLLIGFLAFTTILRPMMRRALTLPPAVEIAPALASGAAKPVKTIADMEGEIEAELDAELANKLGEAKRLPVLTKRLGKVAEEEPEHVARLVRSWLSDEEA
jgi:flagellar M-ring protein FliF